MVNDDWYRKHLTQIKQRAGARYTPELNIDLPISEIFDGICRTENFYTLIRKKYGELYREFKKITTKYEEDDLQKIYNEVNKNINSVFDVIGNIKEYNTNEIDWGIIHNQTNIIQDQLYAFLDNLRIKEVEAKNIKTVKTVDGSYKPTLSEMLNNNIHYIYNIQSLISYFDEFSLSTRAQLSNHPFLLITGSAGTGKTHLLCDIVEQKINNEKVIQHSFMVFGEYYSNGKDFWDQVLENLELGNAIKSKKDLLQMMNELGEKACCRSLFVIDALNENISHAPDFWKNNLESIIKDIKRYPNIALVVSVRSGFENEVMTETQKNLFIEEEHHGFQFKEWEAVNKFFKVFGLPLPEIPLLMPEFQNPLFLLLFCKAFEKRKRKKDKQIFRGHEGATYIFETYIDSISKPIEKEFNIDSGPGKNIWDTIIEKVAEEMVIQNDEKIPADKLEAIIKTAHPSVDHSKLIQLLEKNMLIIKIPKYKNGERIQGFDIRFPFQKFSDHLIGRYIFKNYEREFGKSNKNQMTAKKYFSKRRKLGKFIYKTWNRGIIEALSIQCPEQLRGVEFIEVIPVKQKDRYLYQVFEEAFIESIIWRNPKAFSKNNKNTLEIINRRIIRSNTKYNQLIDAFLSVAPVPNHPFNSLRLHNYLIGMPMSFRDYKWSTFLHYQHGEHGAVDRLLQWSWSDHDNSHINDESIFLCCIALTWFLTTSNRFVRDKATKGIVCLLQNRLHLLLNLLEKFININDPYVLERLFCVAYGCAMRNQNDMDNLKTLSEWVYEHIFKEKTPIAHLLLRDYARGIIEVALKKQIKLKIKKRLIEPPYASDWPQTIPTEEELKAKYYPEDFFKDKSKDRGFLDIWSSVMGFGDFARYVIGTNSGRCEWSGRKLKNPEPNRKLILKLFKKQLTSKQKQLFDEAYNPFYGTKASELFNYITGVSTTTGKLNDKKGKQSYKIKEFMNSLSKSLKKIFVNEIKPFINQNGVIEDPYERFDLKVAQRWIFNRVIELGYNPKLHGEFDSWVSRYSNGGRSEHKVERIGKKYQWIAYHEFLALLSDNYEFRGDNWDDLTDKYKGTWDPHIRDIDPSFVLLNDDCIRNTIHLNEWRGSFGKYDAWEKNKTDTEWIKSIEELPEPKKIIQIIDDNKIDWLMLEGFIKWEEETPPEYKRYDMSTREVWYIIKSYIVKKKDSKDFYEWANKQNFRNIRMPESNNFYEIFIGEYPNSIAFENIRGNYNIWVKPKEHDAKLNIPVTVTDDGYLNEFMLDCSHTGRALMKLPSKLLINEMKLHHRYFDGRFYCENNNLVATNNVIFDDDMLNSLLINKQAFLQFLNDNEYSIFWTIEGEKQTIGGNYHEKGGIGRLELSGCYTIDEHGTISGNVQHIFDQY